MASQRLQKRPLQKPPSPVVGTLWQERLAWSQRQAPCVSPPSVSDSGPPAGIHLHVSACITVCRNVRDSRSNQERPCRTTTLIRTLSPFAAYRLIQLLCRRQTTSSRTPSLPINFHLPDTVVLALGMTIPRPSSSRCAQCAARQGMPFRARRRLAARLFLLEGGVRRAPVAILATCTAHPTTSRFCPCAPSRSAPRVGQSRRSGACLAHLSAVLKRPAVLDAAQPADGTCWGDVQLAIYPYPHVAQLARPGHRPPRTTPVKGCIISK